MKMLRPHAPDPNRPRSTPWRGRGLDVLWALVALLWLAGLVVSIALEAWPLAVLLIAVAVVAVRMVQILGYRD